MFRRPVDLPGHLDDLLAMRPLPKVVWLQLGIRHAEVAARLVAAGIDVVEDRCTLADHRLFGLPVKSA
ncbi:MAG: CoA-binding protein [Myxococcota bacterium]